MVTTLYTELVRTRAPAGWLIKMCISVLLSTLGSPATRDPRPAGLGMLPLHGTVEGFCSAEEYELTRYTSTVAVQAAGCLTIVF